MALNLAGQYLRPVTERGIPLGCPLSPVLGSFFLGELDVALERDGFFHLSFMDDMRVPTHWELRAAVKVVNRALAAPDLDKHPDKTFVGRVEKGFDWLDYHLHPDGLRLAARTRTYVRG